MPERAFVHRVWYGRDAVAHTVRVALLPGEWAYRAAMAGRGALYDSRLLPAYTPALPTISVGNLSVGGTGKTPVAAWIAAELARRGAHPAIVLRGYGADEPLVHQRLHPQIPVVTAPDRVAGIEQAARLRADVAVLDDGFQHRRVRRHADVVLVSADAWTPRPRLLPAGPWREPLSALRRASLVMITRKAASAERAREVEAALCRTAPSVPTAIAHLALGSLHRADGGQRLALADLAGRRVLAIAAVGDPAAFVRQLASAGAVLRTALFADHQAFRPADAARLADAAHGELVVCTLKDAVKLAPLWPRAATPLWYVSLHVVVEYHAEAVHRLLDAVLRARPYSP